MKVSVKRSLLFASMLGLVAVGGVATVNTQANAATKAKTTKVAKKTTTKKSKSTEVKQSNTVKVVSNNYMSNVSAKDRDVTLTGQNAIYSWISGTKAGKGDTVASKTTAGTLQKSKLGSANFRAYKRAVTNKGAVYFKVVSFDKTYRGWIYGGKSTDKFDGGVQSMNTLKDATTPDANNTYRLTDVSANQNKHLLYKEPAFTNYKVGVLKNIDTTKLGSVKFAVQNAKTRTREGDTWYQIKSTDKNIDGSWVKTADLTLVSGKDANVVNKDSNDQSDWNGDAVKPAAVTQDNSTRISYVDANGQMVGTYKYFTTSSKDTKEGDKVSDSTSAANLTLRQSIQTSLPAGYIVSGSVDTDDAVFGGTVKVNVVAGQSSKLGFYADTKTGFTSSNSDNQFTNEIKTDTVAAPNDVSNGNFADLLIAMSGDNDKNISSDSLSTIQALANKTVFNATLPSDVSNLPALATGVSATNTALENIAGQNYAVGTKTFTRNGDNYHYIYVANNSENSDNVTSFAYNNRTAKFGSELKYGVTPVAVSGNAPKNAVNISSVANTTVTSQSNTNN